MTAPARPACSITSSTSSTERTLWPIENSVALRGETARLEFRSDDSFGFQTETLSIETQRHVQIVDAQSQKGDSLLHGTQLMIVFRLNEPGYRRPKGSRANGRSGESKLQQLLDQLRVHIP